MAGRSTFDEATGRFTFLGDDGHVILRGTAHRTTALELAETLSPRDPRRTRLLEDPDQRVYVVDSVDRNDDGAGE